MTITPYLHPQNQRADESTPECTRHRHPGRFRCAYIAKHRACRSTSQTEQDRRLQQRTRANTPTSHLPEYVVKGDEVGLWVDTVRVWLLGFALDQTECVRVLGGQIVALAVELGGIDGCLGCGDVGEVVGGVVGCVAGDVLLQ